VSSALHVSLRATTGCVASGSQIHTKASVGCSEVILDVLLARAHPLRQQRAAIQRAVEVAPQLRALLASSSCDQRRSRRATRICAPRS